MNWFKLIAITVMATSGALALDYFISRSLSPNDGAPPTEMSSETATSESEEREDDDDQT